MLVNANTGSFYGVTAEVAEAGWRKYWPIMEPIITNLRFNDSD
jgi:hypothetical protein